MPQSDVLDIKLQKIIGQIRFRPTLSSFSEAPIIAKELEDKFEEWRATKIDDIALFSPSQKKFLQIGSDVITYVNEKEKNTNELKQLIKTVFTKDTQTYSVNQVRRIGFRIVNVYKCSFDFSDLVDFFYKKFYSKENALRNISTDKPRDVVFVLDGQKNSFLNHVHIGPTKQKEAIKYFSSSFEIDETDLGDNNLYLDVDVSLTEGLNDTNALNKLEEAITENERIINEYVDYIET